MVDNTNGTKLTIATDVQLAANQTWRNNSTNVVNIFGGVDLNNDALTIDGTGNFQIDGVISNAEILPNDDSITLSGSGFRAFAGANTYTGPTFVNGGILFIQNNTGLGSVVGGTSVASGAELQLIGGVNIGAEALTLNGTGTAGGGALQSSSNDSFAGVITLGSATTIGSTGGTLTLGGGIVTAGFTATFCRRQQHSP